MKFFSSLLLSAFAATVVAFPSGAGNCGDDSTMGIAVGAPLVKGVHLTRPQTTGEIAEGNFQVIIQDEVLTTNGPNVIRGDITHSVRLTGAGFKGFVFRLAGAGTTALSISDLDKDTQISSLCISNGVSGITHTDNELKGNAYVDMTVPVGQTVTLEMNIVVQNEESASIHYYSSFEIQTTADAPTTPPVPPPTLPPGQGVIECGPKGDISIAGSSTVEPVARLWGAAYSDACDDIDVVVEGGGSSSGARRVCNAGKDGKTAVDIGDMSRQWKTSEGAVQANGYTYDCLQGDTTISAIQVDVAIDGLSVVAKIGAVGAASCVELLGGLTIDQLRWIYSSYTEAELLATGWDILSVENADGNDATHLWSEFSTDVSLCPAEEIRISGADSESGTYEYFAETIFADFDNGEIFDSARPNGYFNSEIDEEIVEHIVNEAGGEYAIGYFGYAFFDRARSLFLGIPIQNDEGQLIAPTADSINSGAYNPLARRIFMNLNEKALGKTKFFMEYGYSIRGQLDVDETGYVNIPDDDRVVMLTRVEAASGVEDIGGVECGPAGEITIAGSSTVFPVANLWGKIYTTACGPTHTVSVEGGGSSSGARRVCDAGRDGKTAVQIGDMSRGWKDSEGLTTDGFTYECQQGDTTRSAIQLEVAIDGLTVATSTEGVAHDCIMELGGLTIDQLRWIYSSYTEAELVATGWDTSSVPNSDGSDGTHLWSELNANCAAQEILIAGADDQSGTYEYFSETIFPDLDNGEIFDSERPTTFGYRNSEEDEDITAFLEANPAGIGYFGYAYFASNTAVLASVAIQNSNGMMISPDPDTVADGSYNPLSRRIYMNALVSALDQTTEFLAFGLSFRGDSLVSYVGYVPLPVDQRNDMLSRIGVDPPAPTPAPTAAPVLPGICFSGDSILETPSGPIKMEDLKIGDMVFNGETFEAVYSFGHYNKEAFGEYLQISSDAASIKITADHMLFTENGAVPAASVAIGEKLILSNGDMSEVKKISAVTSKGTFAPFTASGKIAVSGVLASNYVSLNGKTSILGFNMQWLAQLFQAPHRIVCNFNSDFCAAESYNEHGISAWVETPLELAQWLVEQNTVVMVAAFAPAFAFVAAAGAIEAILANLVIVVAAAAGAALVMSKNKSA